MRAALGDEVEGLVAGYAGLEWSAASVARMTDAAPHATPPQRDLVALRVANEVDEHADFALRLAPRPHRREGRSEAPTVDAVVALAGAHGLTELGRALRAQHERGLAMPLPAVLVTPAEGSVLVPPASSRRRLHVVLQDSRLGHWITETVPGTRRVGRWVRRRIV